MPDCAACAIAETNPRTGHFQAHCMGCEARSIAQGPEAHSREVDPEGLRRAMRLAWRSVEDYGRGRVLVWNWIKRLEGEKEPD